MKIYTKKGDDGTTGLLGGGRVSKSHLRINAYGTVDELNAYLGLIADQCEDAPRVKFLRVQQDKLFTIGAMLAMEGEPDAYNIPSLKEEDIIALEYSMDELNYDLPPMKNFVLPGGHQHVSFCHIARCVCRRAEREVIALNEAEKVDPLVFKFLNRLSDYLFVLGRKIGKELAVEEVIWKPDRM